MNEDQDAAALFVTVLGLAQSAASSLVRAGMSTLEEAAYIPLDELLATVCRPLPRQV